MRPYISRHRHQRPDERAGKRDAPFRAGRAERESERDLHRHVTPTTITPAKFDWVFGDGSTRTTTGSETINVYASAATKKVKVTVTATDGSTRTAAAD
jgi:PKD domain